MSAQKETYLELNWVTKCSYPGDIRPDYIALYDSDPRERHVSKKQKKINKCNLFKFNLNKIVIVILNANNNTECFTTSSS